MNTFPQPRQLSEQLAHCEQLIGQLVQQTQQASAQYQQLLQQEERNAVQLQQIAQREQQAAQMIQTALQGHQKAIQQLQQISSICNQVAHFASLANPVFTNPTQTTTGFGIYTQH
ncbi:AMP-dependent synthetase and ligase [Brevibacillus sp. NRS-1366]|uniref:AMP-dependent synthetase and ligase n=1 Tax=Brevibacillus sp. NRS-1366 TaxID=3233899 RepID=UPI003D1B6693